MATRRRTLPRSTSGASLGGQDEVVAQPQLRVGEVALAVLVEGVALEAERLAEEVDGGADVAVGGRSG
jgi:hypothetical protein